MSLSEVSYRFGQQLQKQKEKRGYIKLSTNKQNYDNIYEMARGHALSNIPDALLEEFADYHIFDFFCYSLDVSKPIDWHLDIASGKQFPMSFSKDIDIRSDRFGSAKMVWEVNRLQFLLPLALKYRITQDKNVLRQWMALVNSWVASNPYLQGVNWYSNIEVNIRLIVWYFCWQVLLNDEATANDPEFEAFVKTVWLPTIYAHCVYSFNNPSKFSSANNHLISEYAGLYVASSCWKFSESARWNAYALEGLEKEILVQHSPKGLNKEEAAEYIQFITDFFLIPFAVGQRYNGSFSESYRDKIYQIFDYISNLLDVAGNYRKYGDEDDGKVLVVSKDVHFNNFTSILTSAATIFKEGRFKAKCSGFDLKNWLLWESKGQQVFDGIEATHQQQNSIFYKEEGHFIFRKQEGPDFIKETYLHFDAAPLGFLSIAAHGHADALSIALHVDGHPILADVGTYTYHTDKKWRNYFVSTLAHNTICIDDTNQSHQTGPTMWNEHYKTQVQNAEISGNEETVSATHNGYKRLGCSHKRSVHFDRTDNTFSVLDEVSLNEQRHQVTQPWHLHPDVEIVQLASHIFLLNSKHGNRKIKISLDTGMKVEIVKGREDQLLGWYSPSFMVKEPTHTIVCIINSSVSQKLSFKTTIEIL
jgi:hypothetical protein